MFVAWGPHLIQFYNDAYRPILGDKHPAALGASTPDVWKEIWPTIGPMWLEVLQGKAIGFDDFKLTIGRYGYPEDCYFNFSYSPVRDDDGAVAGVLVTFAETTNRVLSERRLKLLDEVSQAMRSVANPQEAMQTTARMLGEHLQVNRCAYAHVLEDQDTFDLIGDYTVGVRSIVGRYRFTDFGAHVHALMLAGRPYVNHDVDKDPQTVGTDLGAYRLTEIQSVICVPLLKNGRFVAAMAVHSSQPRHWTPAEVDLVQSIVEQCWESLERIRADAAVREEARLLELLNRTGTALAAELDLDGLLQRVTDAATEATGARFGAFFQQVRHPNGDTYLLSTLSGTPGMVMNPESHPRSTPLFEPTFTGSQVIRLEDVTKDRRYGHLPPHRGMPKDHLPVRSYLAVPVISRSGVTLGGLFFGHPEPGVFTERSERIASGIAAQAAVAIDNARLYAESRQAAQERHALLEGERAARREAERANALKDQFLATLSHELRTPLTAIVGWVHILRRKLLPAHADLHRGLDIIERSTHTQARLVDDLLDMSRIVTGKLRLQKQLVSPASFVLAAVDTLRPAADAASLRLKVELDEPPGLVLGDPSRLQQVVWNLLSNAIKFTPPGGEIRVAVRGSSGAVEVRVADTGAGIKPEFMDQIFERFRQADGSTTRRYGGLGLGLSIVRHLVEAHDGSIEAFSAGEGQGATFTVRLPLLEAPAVRATSDATVQDNALAGRKVLIVDDEPDVREFLSRILEEAGAKTSVAADATAALESIAACSPDLLLSDIGLPGVDGYELLQRVRQLPWSGARALPAVALTAFARPEDRDRSAAAGYAAHLTKPVEPLRVVAAIVDVLGRSSAPT
nr:GAF domain-containing protein [Pyxidicoccus fallax]